MLSLDSYFMNEVEQVSGAGRSRKVTMVEEYEHEPDMEGALRAVCCRSQRIISGSLPVFRIVSLFSFCRCSLRCQQISVTLVADSMIVVAFFGASHVCR